jgi:folate-binding protein YgfZ
MVPMTSPLYLQDAQAVVWLGGPDRQAYLQRMGTARLDDLDPGRGRATVVTTDEGRAVDLVACHAGPDGLALVCSAAGAAPVVTAQLRRYVLYGDKVTVTDASGQVAVFRLWGEGAARTAALASGLDADAQAPGEWSRAEAAEADGSDEAWLLRHPDPGGAGGWDVVVPRAAAAGMAARLRAAGAAPAGPADYHRLRVGLGLPMWGAEIDGRSNPLELGLLGLVDFAKGCYIGQEVIARLHNYEKVQCRLEHVRSEAPLAAGDPWPPGAGAGAAARRKVGRVTTAVERGGEWAALVLAPRVAGDA